MKNNRTIHNCVYADCETNLERAHFFSSGRAYKTGVVARAIALDVAYAFYALDHFGEVPRPQELIAPMDCASNASRGCK